MFRAVSDSARDVHVPGQAQLSAGACALILLCHLLLTLFCGKFQE